MASLPPPGASGRHAARRRRLWRAGVSAIALSATALVMLALRVPCHTRLPDSRKPGGGAAAGQFAGGGGSAAAAAGAGGGGAHAGEGRDDVFATAASSAWLHAAQEGPPTLTFDACGGHAEQRLSLVYGALIAKRLGRAAVLPDLALSGAPPVHQPDDPFAPTEPVVTAPFGDVFDQPAFTAALDAAGVKWMSQDSYREAADGVIPVRFAVSLGPPIEDVEAYFGRQRAGQHIAVDCPLLKLAPGVVREEEALVRALLGALRPASGVAAHVGAFKEALGASGGGGGGGGKFNMVHLQMDRLWAAQCYLWAEFADDVVDKCFNDLTTVASELTGRGYDKTLPLYVAGNWAAAEPGAAAAVLGAIRGAGFASVHSFEAGPGAAGALAPEVQAHVDFEMGLAAERFLGHSLGVGPSLLVLQRRAAGRWAGHYSGGSMPLAGELPLFSVPWVFTYGLGGKADPGGEWDRMVRAAVNSAVKAGGIAAHCLYAGDPGAEIVGWMEAKGVRVIRMEHEWAGELRASLAAAGADAGAELPKWQRLDAPAAPWLDQYTYVIYTDADVMWRRPFAFRELPQPLPRSVGAGPGLANRPPYNVGVLLMNLPRLRATRARLVAHVLGAAKGGHNVSTQEAYHTVYHPDITSYRLPAKFNAKPYHQHAPRALEDVALVHFHGPKPEDYLAFGAAEIVDSGGADAECPPGRSGAAEGVKGEGGLCAKGLGARACVYLKEWVGFVEGGDEVAALRARWEAACGGRQQPEQQQQQQQQA